MAMLGKSFGLNQIIAPPLAPLSALKSSDLDECAGLSSNLVCVMCNSPHGKSEPCLSAGDFTPSFNCYFENLEFNTANVSSLTPNEVLSRNESNIPLLFLLKNTIPEHLTQQIRDQQALQMREKFTEYLNVPTKILISSVTSFFQTIFVGGASTANAGAGVPAVRQSGILAKPRRLSRSFFHNRQSREQPVLNHSHILNKTKHERHIPDATIEEEHEEEIPICTFDINFDASNLLESMPAMKTRTESEAFVWIICGNSDCRLEWFHILDADDLIGNSTYVKHQVCRDFARFFAQKNGKKNDVLLADDEGVQTIDNLMRKNFRSKNDTIENCPFCGTKIGVMSGYIYFSAESSIVYFAKD
ncbi:hypothetical protein HK100_011249 [Physocladia obscura]|uniref:Uncharacterized protein n=1 Tax=Physocladia obscura TaxID=109957 RepID=A0AAD5T1H9_9FUNG|nr:hypothetical protein HK100_011249 [Physocladia obscura]